MELVFELLDISEITISGSRPGYIPKKFPRGKEGDRKRAMQLAGQKRRKKAKRAQAANEGPKRKKKAAKKTPAKKKKAAKKSPKNPAPQRKKKSRKSK